MSRSHHCISQGRKISNASSTEFRTPTIAAAALQDHLSRQYSLSLSPNTATHRGPLKQKGPTTQRTRASVREGRSGRGTCASRRDQTAVSHGTPSKLTSSGRKVEVEYVLDRAPPPLTLAQRMGLVGAPPRLLDEERWRQVKEASNLRNDSGLPCPICQEDFALNTQVLLSCSHVFHLSCLRAFEKFSQRKRCPLCRSEGYQTRVVYEGAHCWKHRAATLIQSCWRGYVARKWYRKYRETFPPKHPTLRTKHFERKLASLTSRLVESCEQRTSQARSLLEQSDVNIRAARAAMGMWEEPQREVDWDGVWQRAREQLASDCAVCLCPLVVGVAHQKQPRPFYQQEGEEIQLLSLGSKNSLSSYQSSSTKLRSQQSTTASKQPRLPHHTSSKKPHPLHHTNSKHHQITPSKQICTHNSVTPAFSKKPHPPAASDQPHPLHHPASSKQPHPPPAARQLSVLSCGHVLHQLCIDALERFASEDTPHLCPLCRTLYTRKTVDSSLWDT